MRRHGSADATGGGNRLRIALAGALVLLFAGTIASSRPAGTGSVSLRPAQRPIVTASQVRALDGRVSQLTPAQTMVTSPAPVAPAPPTGPAITTGTRTRPALVRLLPTAPTRIPPANTIQFVRTTPTLDRDINAALVSRPSIQRALGGGGVIAPLPGILRQVTETGEVVQLKAIAGRGLPLVYDRARRLFRGTILLGVEDVAGQQRPLSVPVVFQVLNADSADPMDTSFDHTSPPYKVVSVTLSAVRPVRVLSALIPDGGVDVALQLSPTLEIEAGHGALEGFGLEATQVNISLSGVPQLRGRAVTLHTDAGYVEPTLVRLDDQGNASVMLRSGSPGTAHIRASTPGIEPADTTVYFRLPWPTVLASLFGGIVGGFVAGRRKRALAVAVAWGLLGWICYTAGINFSSYTPSVTVGLAVVVAMSFIFAIIGSAILGRLQQ